MALLFEICFYLGVLIAFVGLVWLLSCLVRGNASKAIKPLMVLMLGGALILGPAVLSQTMIVDLGPRETRVDDELHITLTGWDRNDYDSLTRRPETIVLQMANQDVTDQTLDYLADMSQLRELDLNDTQITDAGLAKLARLPALQSLRLRGTKITDDGFRRHIDDMPSLTQLDLRQTAVSAEAVELWKSGNENRRAFQ